MEIPEMAKRKFVDVMVKQEMMDGVIEACLKKDVRPEFLKTLIFRFQDIFSREEFVSYSNSVCDPEDLIYIHDCLDK